MRLNLIQLQQEFKKNRKISKTLAFRLLVLIELAKGLNDFSLNHSEAVLYQIGARNKKSVRTLQRWLKVYREKGWKGLLPRKRYYRKRKYVHKTAAARIEEYRRLYNWGAETIQAHLLRDHNISLSEFKINSFLKKKGFIKKKRRKKIKNKHTKIVKVDHPGTHTQTDVKHLPRILVNKTYVYNFVDHASRWEFKMAFDSYNAMNTKKFFQEVVRHAPFPILCLQTDNGIEFTYRWISLASGDSKNVFEEYLAENNIKHRLIPPGEKELNGLVERSHRADDEELYHRIRPRDLKELNRQLKQHCQWRNENRRKKALGWLTTQLWLDFYKNRNEYNSQDLDKLLNAA